MNRKWLWLKRKNPIEVEENVNLTKHLVAREG